MSGLSIQEDRIQALANILSLVAIISGLDKAAVQRVLIALGSNLMGVPGPVTIEPDLVARLLRQIAREEGEQAALRITDDLGFVAKAWKPVLDMYAAGEPQRVMPYAEIIFALVDHTAFTLQDHGAFDRFGGAELVLPMPQLTAALKSHAVPRPGLVWEIVGFEDPPDQALVASDPEAMFLFKAAATHLDLRFAEYDRAGEQGARREHDVRLDAPLFAAFAAGLLGDMLYWSARLRANAQAGQQIWRRLQTLLAAPAGDSAASIPPNRPKP